MMEALADGGTLSVARICRGVAVFRTTFYRHFESLDDLDERFLHVFFQSMPVDAEKPLADGARCLVEGMLEQGRFFRALYSQERLARYRLRWRGLVDAHLASWYVGGFSSVNAQFAFGAVERYLELGLEATADLDLLTSQLRVFLTGRVWERRP
jgi:hypothetical protein